MQDFDGENMPKDWSTNSVANMQDFENEDMPQDWLTVCQLAPASHDSLPPTQPGARVEGESSSPFPIHTFSNPTCLWSLKAVMAAPLN